MNVGDLVKSVREDITQLLGKVGIVTDVLENADGFYDYEVMFDNSETAWFTDLELELLNEMRISKKRHGN
jgi:hypothetical protein